MRFLTRRLLFSLVALCLLFLPMEAEARDRYWNYARILSSGAPAPSATITVFNSGTLVLSTIFADNIGTPKANPFTADSTGYLFFYADNGRYDVTLTGGGIVAPYTWSDITVGQNFSLNAQTGGTQTFATATTGVDFTISSAVNVHTFAIPNASAAARGFVSTGAQTWAGLKTFTTPIAAGSGGTGVDGSAAANGRLLIGNGAGYTLAIPLGTANQITVTGGAGSLTFSTPQNIDSGASPTFVGATLSGMTTNRIVTTTTGGQLTTAAALTDGQVLIGSSGVAPVGAALTAGAGISVTNGPGSITIANTAVSSAITSINSQTGTTQTIVAGTAGTDFAVSSAGDTHTLNLPDASTSARGVVTTGSQTIAGQKLFSTQPQFTAGSGSASAKVSGTINVNTTSVGNVGAGTDDLITYNFPGGTLDPNGRAAEITAWGTWNDSTAAGTLEIRLAFGATSVITSSGVTLSATGTWRAVSEVFRTGATAQITTTYLMMNVTGGTAVLKTVNAAPAETLSGAIVIKGVGTGGVNNSDIVQLGQVVKVFN